MSVSKNNDLIFSLKKLAINSVSLKSNNINCHVLHTFKKLLKTLLQPQPQVCCPETFLFEIDTVLDYLHEELNTGRLSFATQTVKLNFIFRALEYCAYRGATKLYHSFLP